MKYKYEYGIECTWIKPQEKKHDVNSSNQYHVDSYVKNNTKILLLEYSFDNPALYIKI